jgi:hypothetical protein
MKRIDLWANWLSSMIVREIGRNGGCSFDCFGNVPICGYIVASGERPAVRIPGREFRAELVADWLKECGPLRTAPHFYGAWVEKGEVFLDLSIQTDSAESAWQRAADLGELAFYDVELGKSWPVPRAVDEIGSGIQCWSRGVLFPYHWVGYAGLVQLVDSAGQKFGEECFLEDTEHRNQQILALLDSRLS